MTTSSIHPAIALGMAMLLSPAVMPQRARAQEVPAAPLERIDVDGTGTILQGGVLSPDGRWLVLARHDTPTRSSLWIVPAGGGELVRLTDDGYADETPAWAPAGDRIYFVSNRPARGEPGAFIMSVPFDPRTGRAAGSPRQVTLERQSGLPVPSPDGGMLAYRSGSELRVVPATGGTSRLLAQAPRIVQAVAWETDGSALYYAHAEPARGGPGLYRISVGGGSPVEVLRLRGKSFALISPAARLIAVNAGRTAPRQRAVEIMDWSGRVLARNNVSGDMRLLSFSPDGRTIIAGDNDVGAVMRARPSKGGEPRDLTDGMEYDWPVAWTSDSRSVITHADRDDRLIARILPLNGGAVREVPLPSQDSAAQWHWATPTHVSYRLPTGDARRWRLVALDIATGQRTVLSEKAMQSGVAIGPGGLYRDIDGFHFGELDGDRIEVRSARPGAPARTIFRTSTADLQKTSYAFRGNRTAWFDVIGDSLAVMIADAPDTPARVVATLPAPEPAGTCCRGVIAFSPDGDWLALQEFGDANAGNVLILRVPAEGRADVHRVNLGVEYWYEPRWLPDNSGFTVIAGIGAAAWVAFVPTAPGETVRHLSRDEDQPAWGHELSPDGRYVVYPAEVWRGSSLWRMDLAPVLSTSR